MNGHMPPILKRLPAGPCVMAEIGVAAGLLSQALLLARADLSLWMVDSWRFSPPGADYREWCVKNGDPNGYRSPTDVLADMVKAMAVKVDAGDRCRLIVTDSLDAAAMLADGTFDLAFIDADHSEAGCAADVEAWWQKVKIGGWIGGHDFARFRDDGVGRAVRAFADVHGLQIETDDDSTWFIRKAGA